MATGTQGTTARRYHTAQVHYLRKDFDFEDTTFEVGTVPGGSLIVSPLSGVQVTTAFASQTADVLDIGTASVTEAFASDLDLTTAGFVAVDVVTGLAVTVDTVIQAVYTQTGTASTVGEGSVVIAYLPQDG